MAILANGILHLNILIRSYWLEGELFGEKFNEGLWEIYFQFKCTKYLDHANVTSGNLSLVLLLLYCYLILLHY